MDTCVSRQEQVDAPPTIHCSSWLMTESLSWKTLHSGQKGLGKQWKCSLIRICTVWHSFCTFEDVHVYGMKKKAYLNGNVYHDKSKMVPHQLYILVPDLWQKYYHHSVLTICTQTGTCDTRSGDPVFFSAAFDEFSLVYKELILLWFCLLNSIFKQHYYWRRFVWSEVLFFSILCPNHQTWREFRHITCLLVRDTNKIQISPIIWQRKGKLK